MWDLPTFLCFSLGTTGIPLGLFGQAFGSFLRIFTSGGGEIQITS